MWLNPCMEAKGVYEIIFRGKQPNKSGAALKRTYWPLWLNVALTLPIPSTEMNLLFMVFPLCGIGETVWRFYLISGTQTV